MTDTWNDMRKAKEESYFDRKNREALERLGQKQQEEKPRLSPITGEEMEQVVLHGVVIDRCKTSGGIWLDAGELEQLVDAMAAGHEKDSGFLKSFFKGISGS
ncbi:MAG: zf-TFIIB domain-containing protein [Bdellovibrionales bacterium]|nr:zf-TFIIB domain-containing protein [Bdellovibrionales bacterium]